MLLAAAADVKVTYLAPTSDSQPFQEASVHALLLHARLIQTWPCAVAAAQHNFQTCEQ